jgi:hypothetical protein
MQDQNQQETFFHSMSAESAQAVLDHHAANNPDGQLPLGIKVIAILMLVSVVISLFHVNNSTILELIELILIAGLFLKNNLARIILLVFIWIELILQALVVLAFLAVPSAAALHALYLLSVGLNLVVSISLVYYLTRPRVKAVFN